MTSPTASRQDERRPVTAGHAAPAPARIPGVVLVLAALDALPLAALIGAAAAAPVIGDPGVVVRWGLLYARAVHDLAAAATVGLLIHAAYLMPETMRTNRRIVATRIAGIAAGIWALAGVCLAVLGLADTVGTPITDPAFVQQFTTFAFSYEPTRVQLISAGIAAAVSVGAALARTRVGMSWMSVLAIAGVLPLALAGHAAGATDHMTAVNALAVHLVAVVVWVGGLLGLATMRPLLGSDFAVTARRFSTLAGWCFAAVALSGLQSAAIRLGSLGNLTSAYGLLVIVKSVSLVLLGLAGWVHRRALLHRLDTDTARLTTFVRLVVAELAVMGVALGTAVALARSAPPVTAAPLPNATMAFVLTGFPAPPPIDNGVWFSTWRTDWLFLAIAVLAVGLYVAGVVRLRLRGDSWPAHRTLVWVLGWLVFLYATCGAPGVYGAVLFSAHMVMHMVIAMIVPLLLVPAAPILLALRALPPRRDKTWGPREVLLQVLHSRVARVLTNPVVASVLFFGSLVVFYYSPLFQEALTTHTGHLLMVLHFLLTGYLFVWVLIGIDPGPKRWPPLILIVVLFATMSFHAFFGVVMTSSNSLLAPDFFDALKLYWVPDPIANQREAGAIAWGIGEAPTVALTLLVALAWVRSDRAETRRRDRQADRDGDAELAAYNAHLAELKRRNERKG
jgi:putative copper resistance protein D